MQINKNKSHGLQQDFSEFVKGPPETTPTHLLNNIQAQINSLENPGFKKVVSKLTGLHLFASGLTLSFCPQFGFNPFLDHHGITHYFMQWGETVCLFLCGAIYLGMSALVFRIFLSQQEWKKYRQHEFANLTALISLSLFFYSMTGPDFRALLAIAWTIGAFMMAFAIDHMPLKHQTKKV